MQLEEIISILTATRDSQCNNASQNGSLHRCPACGETLDGSNWRISNVFNGMKICSKCKDLDLDDPTPEACAEMLKNWWIIQAQEAAGPFPSDPVLFHIMDPEVNDDATITFLCECWFDLTKKFGLDPSILADEDTWLNVYLTIHPQTKEISMCYTVDDNEKNECFVYVPTQADRDAIFFVIEHYCRQRKETLQDIVDSVLPATEEQEFEIPVKEINYGVAKIRATSLEEALKKVYDAYGNGEIDWGKTDFDFTVPTGGADHA